MYSTTQPNETKTQAIPDISDVKQSIIALYTKLQVLHLELGTKMSTILMCITLINGCLYENNETRPTSLPTCAQIVYKDVANISDTVNKAVKTLIAIQKKDHRVSTSCCCCIWFK